MKSLVSEWVSKKLPIFNGVVRADGHAFHVFAVDPPRSLPYVLTIEEESDLNFDCACDWVLAIPVAKAVDQKTGAVALVGECGMGGDGFVALQKGESPLSLQWVAFFDFSNPFETVRFEGDTLVVSNTLDEDWFFRFSSPPEIVIHKSVT